MDQPTPPPFPNTSTRSLLESYKALKKGMSSKQLDDSSAVARSNNIRVCLRLRPMNKLEEARRSRHCVVVHEEKTSLTVDSPLDGAYDFSFDRIFDENSTQAEVYSYAGSSVAPDLLRGFNCTVIAYGQTGTGKTHTMTGAGGDLGPCHPEKPSGDENASTVSSLDNVSQRDQASTTSSHEEENEEDEDEDDDDDEDKSLSENDEASGMMPRIIRDLFKAMSESPESIEFIVRCSYIENYLEKITDLLDPSAQNLTVTEGEDGEEQNQIPLRVGPNNVYIKGMSEACCFDVADVMTLLVRGNANRTVSSTRMNTDSSRSHAIFTVSLEQRDTLTEITRMSKLHLVDLAGSEVTKACKGNRRGSFTGTAIHQEAMMINKSLVALGTIVRMLAESQAPTRRARRRSSISISSPTDAIPYTSSKLTRILKDAFGGNCRTTMVLTASPSSYNILETINTIRFGQKVKKITNIPRVNEEKSLLEYKTKLAEADKKQKELRSFVRALAKECTDLKHKHDVQDTSAPSDTTSSKSPLWNSIQAILEDSSSHDGITTALNEYTTHATSTQHQHPHHTDKNNTEAATIAILEQKLKRAEQQISTLKEDLSSTENARSRSVDLLSEVRSEATVLKNQNEKLSKEKKKETQDLMKTKADIQQLLSQKLELQNQLRTSQFRENEAVIFLRQFRRFYRNLLRNKAAQGTGDTADIISKFSDVPDLEDIIDVDKLLYQSGLIEEEEMNDDTYIGAFTPTPNALTRSNMAAEKRQAAAFVSATDSSLTWDQSSSTQDNPPVSDSIYPKDLSNGNNSDDERPSPPPTNKHALITSYPHFLQRSSAEQAQKERELTADLRRMTEKCIQLQIALNEQKANVDVLTNRSGSLRQKRLAQEAITLRTELDRRTHDVQLIIWKMNELNMVNKVYDDKMKNRDDHVRHLEECLLDLQNANRSLVADRLESEAKLRQGLENLQALVDAMTIPLWQFGESGATRRRLANRVMMPVRGQLNQNDDGQDYHQDQTIHGQQIGEEDDDDSLSQSLDQEVRAAYKMWENVSNKH